MSARYAEDANYWETTVHPCRYPREDSQLRRQTPHSSGASSIPEGAIAVHFVKAILTAAEVQPLSLFGFIELPAAGMHPGGCPLQAVSYLCEKIVDSTLAIRASSPADPG
jgi:hypothetical protein